MLITSYIEKKLEAQKLVRTVLFLGLSEEQVDLLWMIHGY